MGKRHDFNDQYWDDNSEWHDNSKSAWSSSCSSGKWDGGSWSEDSSSGLKWKAEDYPSRSEPHASLPAFALAARKVQYRPAGPKQDTQNPAKASAHASQPVSISKASLQVSSTAFSATQQPAHAKGEGTSSSPQQAQSQQQFQPRTPPPPPAPPANTARQVPQPPPAKAKRVTMAPTAAQPVMISAEQIAQAQAQAVAQQAYLQSLSRQACAPPASVAHQALAQTSPAAPTAIIDPRLRVQAERNQPMAGATGGGS